MASARVESQKKKKYDCVISTEIKFGIWDIAAQSIYKNKKLNWAPQLSPGAHQWKQLAMWMSCLQNKHSVFYSTDNYQTSQRPSVAASKLSDPLCQRP